MRIAFVCQTYPPEISGAATFARNLAEGMASRGHLVRVVAASDTGAAYRWDTGNLSVVRFPSHRNPLRVGQHFTPWPRDPILRELRPFHPEIVHLNDLAQAAFAGISAAGQLNAKVVLTTHQLPWLVSTYAPGVRLLRVGIEEALWRYGRWLLGKCHAVVSPTDSVAQVVARKTGLTPYVISCGVDTNRFRPAQDQRLPREAGLRLGLDSGRPIILHVGQLHGAKRVEVVCRAAAAVVQRTDAQLVIAGDGPGRRGLERLCRNLGLGDRVQFLGYVSMDGFLPDLYRLSSVFVTASEIETQGLVLLEAAASGLPIASVRTGCIPEIVHHGKNGLLSDPGDASGLAESLISILQNPALHQSMGAASRRLAEAHTVEATVEAHAHLYRSLVEEIPSRHRS